VIGLLGLGMVFVIYPLFCHLAKKNRIMTITWIYVFTVILVITFAIEIGQKISKTGNMDFGDIMYGVVGFLAMFVVFCLVRAVYHGIRKLIAYLREKNLPENG
jgi:glycopeptide antibiotics resistance protein